MASGIDEYGGDPFISPPTSSNHHRFSNFDSKLFALGPTTSPDQAKRALEAHLAETERRIEEASKLGTTLVQQRRDLADRLRDVEKQQTEADITPELRQKLVEIEREYNQVERETARAFLPKSRVPSGERSGSPFTGDSKGPLSPSKFESQATNSPSKLSVPNRKQRNQPANRVHDIEFATEISTSLLSQVRHLQSLLLEKEDALKTVNLEKSRLEIEAEGFLQRLRILDESEQRYKDENWNLETQLQEQVAAVKEAADREKRLNQSLNALQAEKTAAQKEIDEIKLNHAKLVEDHAAALKHHDVELGNVRRNVTLVESERGALQRKVEDLAGQNQELARAVTAQRVRLEERDQARGLSDEDFETAPDNATPEHSPPPSPVKATPRHSMLESETLKSSLQHAHRMIQSLKGNIHREKTEKLELKRMLQDARDEVEKTRMEGSGLGTGNAKRSRKPDPKESKRPPNPAQLGGARRTRSEILMDDNNWEDEDAEGSPSQLPGRFPVSTTTTDYSDHFETANESEAFETANERATETEDFQTGAEEMSGSDELTETEEGPSTGTLRIKPITLAKPTNRYSFMSTASTSDDEDNFEEVRSPTLQHQQSRMRLRASRASSRRSRAPSEDPQLHSSPPPSRSSRESTPAAHNQSLFAELGNMSDDDESLQGTPSRSNFLSRSTTPGSRPGTARRKLLSPDEPVPPLPKLIMIDSGVMTEPWEQEPTTHGASASSVIGAGLEGAAIAEASHLLADNQSWSGSVIRVPMLDAASQWLEEPSNDFLGPDSHTDRLVPTSAYSDMSSQYDLDIEEQVPLSLSAICSEQFEPVEPATIVAPEPEPLAFSSIKSVDSQPIEPVEIPVPLAFSSIHSVITDPIEPIPDPAPESAPLAFSSIHSLHTQPIEPVEIKTPLEISPIQSVPIEPVEVEIPLDFSSIQTVNTPPIEPTLEPILESAPLVVSSVRSVHTQPIESAEPTLIPGLVPAPEPLKFSFIQSVDTQPIEPVEPTPDPVLVPGPVSLDFSSIQSVHTHPIEPVEIKTPLGISTIQSVNTGPVEPEPEPVPEPAPLAFSSIQSVHSEPIEPKLSLAFSSIQAVNTHPIEPIEVKPEFAVSSIQSVHTQPIEPTPVIPEPLPLAFSSIQSVNSHPIEPVAPVAHLAVSSIHSVDAEPIERQTSTPLGFSSIQGVHTEPSEPQTPHKEKRDVVFVPFKAEGPETPKARLINSLPGRNKNKVPSTPIIAEDETRQSPNQSPMVETPESQRPFRELSTNTNERAIRKPRVEMADESSQTALTAEQIDEMLRPKVVPAAEENINSVLLSPSRTANASPSLKARRSQESLRSIRRAGSRMADAELIDGVPSKRSTSPGSVRRESVSSVHPPLPTDHKQVIAAAAQRTGSSNGPGSMGPPPGPVSAYRASANPLFRPRTPNTQSSMTPVSQKGISIQRNINSYGTADIASLPGTSAQSRRSSVSSFVSELDNRFNIRSNVPMRNGVDPSTDPRMINAITQTMIGEYLWKYTRKTGRAGISENRHRRFFWVHPYTRTLYWSDQDPSSAGKSEVKAKSVQIEAVRVVTDDNPMPPGLHRKSIVIMTPGRTVKFTAATGQRHETWFNALSYLLLRGEDDANGDGSEAASAVITQDDVAEFNPGYGNDTNRHSRPSISSYNSRNTRNESRERATVRHSAIPTGLAQGSTSSRLTAGTFSRLSSYWKAGGKEGQTSSFSSRRSRRSVASLYDVGDVYDSAEDLREMIERQDRESDRLENVRACCDGKHDVGHLHHHSARNRHSHNFTPGSTSSRTTQIKSSSWYYNESESVNSPSFFRLLFGENTPIWRSAAAGARTLSCSHLYGLGWQAVGALVAKGSPLTSADDFTRQLPNTESPTSPDSTIPAYRRTTNMPPALGSRRVNSMAQTTRSSASTRPQQHNQHQHQHQHQHDVNNTTPTPAAPNQAMPLPANIAPALITPQREIRESSANLTGSMRKPRQNLDERDHLLMLKTCYDLRHTFKDGTKSQFWTGVSAAFQRETGKLLAQMSATVGRLVETRRRQLSDWENGIIREKPGGELNEAIDRWMEFLKVEDAEAEEERMRQVDARRRVEEARKEARRQSHIAAEHAHQRAQAEVQAAHAQAQTQAHVHAQTQVQPQAQSQVQAIAPAPNSSPIAVTDLRQAGAGDREVSLANGQIDMNGYPPRKRLRGERELSRQLQDQLQHEVYSYHQPEPPEPPKRVIVEGALTKEDWRDIMGNDARLRTLETKIEKIEAIVSQNNKLLLQLLQNQNKSSQEEEQEQRVPVHLDAEFERDYL
ncbi:hypothetical protein B7463_g8293, partial [Scytalidium lignicola]